MMTKKSVAICLIQCSLVVFARPIGAQHATPDSLRAALEAYRPPVPFQAKDTAYFALADAVCDGYFDGFALDSLLAVSDRTLHLLDKCSSNAKEVDNRLDFYKMRFFRYKGIALHQSGDYVDALPAFQQYAVQAEKLGSVKDIGNSYTSMAYCHRDLEDYQLAYEYAKKAQAVLKDSPYKSALANTYAIIGSYYDQVFSKTDSAIYYSKAAIKLYHQANNVSSEVNAIFDLIQWFSGTYQTDSCLIYLDQVKDFVREQQNPDLLVRYNAMLGSTLYAKGNIEQALYHLRLASKQAVEMDHPQSIFNVNKFLTLALAADGQTIASLKYMQATMDAYANDIDTEKARQINSAQLNFEFEKKQALANVELQKQKRLRDISLVGLLLGLVVALLLFRLYSQSKRTARLLADKNDQIEKSYRELKETQAQLVLTEKQREAQSIRVRIARDIHDELGAGLTKITMLSDFVRRKLPMGNAEVAHLLQRIIENSKGVSASLNEIVWAVNPSHDTLESLANGQRIDVQRDRRPKRHLHRNRAQARAQHL